MIKKIKKLCRLLCISALIGILLFPGQVMASCVMRACKHVDIRGCIGRMPSTETKRSGVEVGALQYKIWYKYSPTLQPRGGTCG